MFPKFAAVMAATALLVAACGDDDDSTAETPSDDRSAGLGDDIAAVVNGHEIEAAEIDEQVEALAENPEMGAQLQQEGAEELIRSQILSLAIQTRLLIDGAEELDQPVTDDDVAEARTEAEEQAGGAEAFDAMIKEQGLTDETVTLQMTGLAAQDNVEAALAEESGADPSEEPPSEPGPDGQAPLSPSEQAAQEYFVEQIAAADVVVNDDIGTWDPQTGQVTPPGGMPTAPAPPSGGAPAPEGEQPEPNADDGS